MATNLEFINSFDSGSGNSAISCDNVFSDKYSSYFVTLRAGYSVQGYSSLRFIDSAGAVETSATQDTAILMLRAQTTFQERRLVNNSQIERINYTYQNAIGGDTSFYVHNPYDSSSFTFIQWQNVFESGGYMWGMKGIGVEKTAQTIRGFQIYSSGEIRDNKIAVFGVK